MRKITETFTLNRKSIWILISLLNFAHCNPIPDNSEGYNIESRLNNYRKRFEILAANVDEKYTADLQALIERFNVAFDSHDSKTEQYLLENYVNDLDPEFSAYIQYELDAQHLNQDINMEKWFLEQLLQQLDNSELADDIQLLLPLYRKAKQSKNIDDKYDYFSNIDTRIPQRLLNFLEADPTPTSVLNVQLQYFREFLLYLLQECTLGEFEGDIKSLLNNVDQALGSETTYEDKVKLIDIFDSDETNLEHFLNAKAYEFELYKFGLE